ncbi:hypothetical protein [Rossellomorea arthrocnemi]|uniref:hypothetical protein n=1 Tax=Rossellomorea arthrocnemi TaxID=2769542 RepID=UPI001918031F|nr:hypothetical protein [Rossellomorea arthrocnemi]
MQKHLIQAFLFLGVISIPTFASAEGGLLSNVTNEVNAVTDKATTSNEVLSAEETSEDENHSERNLLSGTVDSVTAAVDQTTGTVADTVDAATGTAGNAVDKTVEHTTKPVTDIVGESAAPVTETVNNTTKAVTNTVEQTTKSVTGTVDSTTKTVTDTVEETTKSVTGTVDSTTKTVTDTVEETTKSVSDSLADDKPLLDVDLSDHPEVKINTGNVDIEVSKEPEVKVETGGLEADVSNEPSAKVEDEPSVARPKENDEVEVERGDAPKEPVKQEVPVEGSAEEAEKSSLRLSEAKQVKESLRTNPAEVEQKEPAKVEESEKQHELPFTPVKKMEPVLTTTTLNSTSQSSSTSGVSGQVSGSTSLWYVSDQQAVTVNFQTANMYEKNNRYYDQWLNAPPSQPPQQSLLFKSI